MRRALLVALAALAALAGSSAVASAQSRVTTSVDTTLVTVGDRIELTVAVEHTAGAAVVWPDSIDAGPFEVLAARTEPTRTSGDRATSRARFTLTAFELGELEIPPFELRVLGADGTEETLRTDRFGVEVTSVGVDDTGDIRDIRGPLAIPVSVVTLSLWLVVLALLALAGWLLWNRLRKDDEAPAARIGPPPRPPHEIALEALARLEASTLLDDGEIKEYHIRVSEIIRTYVEDRFGVPALERTTWELLGGLQAAGVDDGLRRDLRAFLEPCDAVKFAKARPTPEASREVLRLGRAIVERTIPAPESEPTEGSKEPADAPFDRAAADPRAEDVVTGAGGR